MSVTVLWNRTEVDRPWEVRFLDVTEEEFFRDAPDHRIAELVEGEMIVASPVEREHQEVVQLLVSFLLIVLKRRGLGQLEAEPFPMRLQEGLIREPDLMLIRPENAGRISSTCVDGPADLVIEVVSRSASSRRRDLVEKPEEYDRHGVGEYWAIDREGGRIVAHQRAHAGARFAVREVRTGRLESIAIPGLWIETAWVLGSPVAGPEECLAALGLRLTDEGAAVRPRSASAGRRRRANRRRGD